MEITAFRLARHSVGRPRNVFIRKSSIGSTVATPTNLHLPSLSNLFPLPLLIVPFDSSDVKTVLTSSGGGLYILPAENQKLAKNSRSTCMNNICNIKWGCHAIKFKRNYLMTMLEQSCRRQTHLLI